MSPFEPPAPREIEDGCCLWNVLSCWIYVGLVGLIIYILLDIVIYSLI